MIPGLRPFAMGVDPTRNNDEMDVEMQPELTAPGVEDSLKSNPGAQALGVVPEFQQGFGSALESYMTLRLKRHKGLKTLGRVNTQW